jgi:hypothetical protein
MPNRLGQIAVGERHSPATEIKQGQRLSPQTEIQPGQRLSPQTEFKRGQSAHNRLEVGAETIRIESATGNPRGWVKVAEPNVWRPRAIVVWERHNGVVPKGMIVHHKDRNTINDVIENLELATRKQHVAEHRQELLEARKAKQARAAQVEMAAD